MTESEWQQLKLVHKKVSMNFGRRLLHGKQLFWTNDNMFGWTTVGVRPGDVICVFGGANTPHVLGRVDEACKDDIERWQFVGDAYVHGLIYGEADDIDVEEPELCMV